MSLEHISLSGAFRFGVPRPASGRAIPVGVVEPSFFVCALKSAEEKRVAAARGCDVIRLQ
jgi:hypothetical protein